MKKLAKATGKKVYAFDLPAGWSCPAADICLSKSDKKSGKITDGKDSLFRCYAASLEAVYTAVRRLRWHNFDLLRNTSDMHKLIADSLPTNLEILRLHSSGDFFNKEYHGAWMQIARENPSITFYGYTKMADLFLNKSEVPTNVLFIQSHGGKLDHMVTGLSVSYVVTEASGHDFPVFSTDEQSELHILAGGGDFGLLIHGVQPKGFKEIDESKRKTKTKN